VRNLLIADPHTCHVQVEPTDEFLILASDGLWDVFTPAEAVQLVLDWLQRYTVGTTTSDISRILFDEATARASKDNITILVLFFRERKLLKARSLERTPSEL
jgi:serine/threonine protein phosphatase PrpC